MTTIIIGEKTAERLDVLGKALAKQRKRGVLPYDQVIKILLSNYKKHQRNP